MWEDIGTRIQTGSRNFKARMRLLALGGGNCFGPTTQEIKDFTSSNGIILPTEIFPAEDPRHGGQIRSSADFAALDGMNGFDMALTLWAGKVKIVNCPIFASDLNMDRTFSTDEIIAFPNHVLEADRDGNFTRSTRLDEPNIGK